MKKFLLSSSVLLLVFLFAPWILQAKADRFDPLPTAFAYSEKQLSQIRSPCLITIERIDKWETPLQNYFEKNKIRYPSQLRFYTYLYLAQRDAAFLSYNIHRSFTGSLDPLTKEIVLTFFPGFTDFPEICTDAYSEELAQQIWPPYLKRLEKEKNNPHTFKPCDGIPIPERLQTIAKWIPWTAPLPKVPPPSMDLENQIELLKEQRCGLSDSQRNLVYAWAGEKGLKYHWRILVNDYMHKESVPLGKTLFVRSILMMGLYDSLIASEEAKYAYCIPRPFLLDSTIDPLIQKPQSPGYPSGHGAQAGTACVILSYFFPQSARMWHEIAENSAQSRLWGGVHMPQDAIQGMILGKKVGEMTLNMFRTGSEAKELPARRCPFSQ